MDVHVGLLAEDGAERGADFFRRQVAGADLIEQRLERVVVVAVHDRDIRARDAVPERRSSRRSLQ